MNNAVFGKNKDIKLVTTERRKNYLTSELNCHTRKPFKENLLATEKKTKKLVNEPACLEMLELSKILMHEFLYDYVKPKYDEKAKFCYLDTDSFIVYIKTDDNCKDITENVESRFDTSNYELYWPLPKEKNKN